MKIRDKSLFWLFLIAYTLLFVIIVNCSDLINKRIAETEKKLHNGNYEKLAWIEAQCDVCMDNLAVESENVFFQHILDLMK